MRRVLTEEPAQLGLRGQVLQRVDLVGDGGYGEEGDQRACATDRPSPTVLRAATDRNVVFWTRAQKVDILNGRARGERYPALSAIRYSFVSHTSTPDAWGL